MKEKQFACVVLGMAIFACFFAVMKMQTKLQEARKEADAAKESAETAGRERIVSAANFTDFEKKTRPEIKYYNIWKPHFESFPSTDTVTTEFEIKMKQAEIDAFSQDFVPTAYDDKYEFIKKVQRVDLVLVGGYAQLFNFLGLVESELNTARVTAFTVRKATGDEDIRMELTIDVPVMEEEKEAS